MVTLRSGWLQVCERCKCFYILLNYWNEPKKDVKRMEGDVTEKDNVLLSLCSSKNSTTNGTRWKEGFIYRNIAQIDFHLGIILLFCLHCCLDLSQTWGWKMRLRWRGGGVKSVFLIKGVERRQKTGRGLWATSLIRPSFLWTSSLTAGSTHKTRLSFALIILCYFNLRSVCTGWMNECTYVSGEVPGLLGAGFAEAASFPDSTGQKNDNENWNICHYLGMTHQITTVHWYANCCAHLAAIELGWQDRSLSRCGQRCGRWWLAWWCSQCGRLRGWMTEPSTRGWVHNIHA